MSYQVAREDAFDFRSAEYHELYERASATVFQHPGWLHHLYEVLAPRRGAEKVVVTIRDGHRLLGVLPLVRRRHRGLRMLEYADLGVNDYAAPVITAQARQGLVEDPELGRMVRRALGRFDLLRVERVAHGRDDLAALVGGASVSRHLYHSHVVTLPETEQEWSAGLRPDFARHLERKYKRLRPKGGHRMRAITEPDEIDQALDRLREFRAARFGERGGVDLVAEPDYFAFYRAVAVDQNPATPHRLEVLEVGGAIAAVALDLDDGERELFLLVGYDVGRLRNYSLGLLIVDQLARKAVARGRSFFDLTVGDEPYKADFGAQPQPLFELRVARSPLGFVAIHGRDGYLRLRHRAKQTRDVWRRRRAARERASKRRNE